MNLHTLQNNVMRWVWTRATGANGASLGTHLWQLEEGNPEPLTTEDARLQWYQTPQRFRWMPFRAAELRLQNRAWTIPLCGKRSQSRWPRYSTTSLWDYQCQDCTRESMQRGIITINNMSNPRLRAIRAEQNEWIASRQESPT